MPDDSERTDDAAFTEAAADHLGEATAALTREVAAEEDGSSPDEPAPDTYPDDDEDV